MRHSLRLRRRARASAPRAAMSRPSSQHSRGAMFRLASSLSSTGATMIIPPTRSPTPTRRLLTRMPLKLAVTCRLAAASSPTPSSPTGAAAGAGQAATAATTTASSPRSRRRLCSGRASTAAILHSQRPVRRASRDSPPPTLPAAGISTLRATRALWSTWRPKRGITRPLAASQSSSRSGPSRRRLRAPCFHRTCFALRWCWSVPLRRVSPSSSRRLRLPSAQRATRCRSWVLPPARARCRRISLGIPSTQRRRRSSCLFCSLRARRRRRAHSRRLRHQRSRIRLSAARQRALRATLRRARTRRAVRRRRR